MKPPIEFKVLRVRECVATDMIDTPERAAQYWRANIPHADWYDPCKEAFVVFVLNTRRRIIGHNLVSLGSLDSVCVHPREVFRPAIAIAGSAIVLAHNHPSLDPTPSEADIKVTRDLVRAGQLLKIDVLDHIIIGDRHVSLREAGYFNV
jgi:DNA repair protein RadC